MKLVLSNRSYILQLCEHEIESFAKEHKLVEILNFGNNNILQIVLEATPKVMPEATFRDNQIYFYFPESKITTWKNTALQGIDNHQAAEPQNYVCIEKEKIVSQVEKMQQKPPQFQNPLIIDLVD
jgi:hypothetical protein